jgi:hypothetical protein
MNTCHEMNFAVGKRPSKTLSELDDSETGTREDADSGQADTYKSDPTSEANGVKLMRKNNSPIRND